MGGPAGSGRQARVRVRHKQGGNDEKRQVLLSAAGCAPCAAAAARETRAAAPDDTRNKADASCLTRAVLRFLGVAPVRSLFSLPE